MGDDTTLANLDQLRLVGLRDVGLDSVGMSDVGGTVGIKEGTLEAYWRLRESRAWGLDGIKDPVGPLRVRGARRRLRMPRLEITTREGRQ